ncbi:hypothetical protein [Streptomyces sp. Root369]|uniref:hypothetical protein n=1 Tax=Streptomyces sp. Root369 TaxID=1736523 RepID=UPI000AB3229C
MDAASILTALAVLGGDIPTDAILAPRRARGGTYSWMFTAMSPAIELHKRRT